MLRNRFIALSEEKAMSSLDTVSDNEEKITVSGEEPKRKTSLASSQIGMPGKLPSIHKHSGNAESHRRPSLTFTKGPSLVGLLASKRLASRFIRQRYGSIGEARFAPPPKKEPTYRMVPHNKFDAIKVEERIKCVMEQRLENFPYNPKFCANMSKVLSDEIKGDVKMLNFDRYKIVCIVLIGQRKDQGAQMASRCAWNEALDNYASYTFMNENIFATAVVYGIYTD